MDAVADFIVSHWVIFIQAVFAASLLLILWVYLPVLWGAPWVPGRLPDIRRMLELAEVKPGQMVVDLGAGDGRIVITAARTFRARAAGVEIDPLRWVLANLGIRILGLRDQAIVRLGNMRSFPVEGADVVTLYLLKGINQELRDHLQKSLRPGARVVSHTCSISGWTPTVLDERRGIFVYEIGRTGEDTQTRICA